MHEDIKEVLYTEEQIQQRIREIGAALTEEYAPLAARGEKNCAAFGFAWRCDFHVRLGARDKTAA